MAMSTAAVKPSAVRRLAQDLIRIPSESSDPQASDAVAPERLVAERLRADCQRLELDYRLDEAAPGRWNLAARIPRPGAPRVLIAGHIDTVSAKGMARAFDAEIANGQLRGRGACDDKGPLAAVFTALAQVIDEGRRPEVDVTVLATADEEVGMIGARAWAAAGDPADLVLCLEPTGLTQVVAHKGLYRCRIDAHGTACHSSRPELGHNAIEALLPLLHGVLEEGRALAAITDPLLGHSTLAITGIGGGTAINVIPDSCHALIDVRLIPGIEPADVGKRIAHRCSGAAITELFANPALARRTPAAGTGERFDAALRAGGVEPTTTTAPWCSDGSYLQQLGPCMVWGPGRIEHAHTIEEHIDLAQLEQATDILYRFLTLPA